MENLNFETKKHYWIQTNKQQSRDNCMLLTNILMNLRGNLSRQQKNYWKQREKSLENFAALVVAESEIEQWMLA